jgi:hypothetical protein
VENVTLSDITVRYRGGLKMEHAVEQRQSNQQYSYTAHKAATANQSLPWLVNTFFAKNEALLPRIAWSAAANGGAGGWVPDPYNVPEMPREYPEPSNFGILPAYGLYARHVRGLTIRNLALTTALEDERPPVVLDDVDTATVAGLKAPVKIGSPMIVRVTNTRKRDAGREYVKDHPYRTTTVRNTTIPPNIPVQNVTVDRPAPGTPPDALYTAPTAPDAAHPYAYAVPNAAYPKPRSVYRPFFDPLPARSVAAGAPLTFVVSARSIADGAALQYSASQLPAGATFDAATRTFTWTPQGGQAGAHVIRFTVDDGVLPVHKDVTVTVASSRP